MTLCKLVTLLSRSVNGILFLKIRTIEGILIQKTQIVFKENRGKTWLKKLK